MNTPQNNWEKAMDKQWDETEHYPAWEFWVKDMTKELLQQARAEVLKEVWDYLIEWKAFDPNIDKKLHLIWLKKKLGVKL